VIVNGKGNKLHVFAFLLAGQFGPPSFSLAAFIGFAAAICASFVESVGDYFATAKCCHVMPPPNHAISRGILVEGLASFVSGTVGAAHATTSYSQNISLLRLTKAGLRTLHYPYHRRSHYYHHHHQQQHQQQ
jgi:nucleobase transporter 1/2